MLSTVLPALCSAFNLNNKNVNALIARRLSGCTCTRSLTMNSKFSIPHSAFIVRELERVNPDNLLKCVNL